MGGLRGSLRTSRISAPNEATDFGAQWGLRIAGAIDADITVQSEVYSPILASSLESGRTISIGSQLALFSTQPYVAGGLQFATPQGLKGQVIVGSSGAGLWSGAPVTLLQNQVPVTTLSPIPYYDQLSAEIGAGAVGQAPFNLHGTNCDPPNGDTNSGVKYVRLSLYGPVQMTTGKPVQVFWRPPSLPPPSEPYPWVDISDKVGMFFWPDGVQRDLLLVTSANSTSNTPVFTVPGNYQIVPLLTGDNALRCAGVTGSPPVAPWNYTFTVLP